MAEDKKSRACHYLQPQEWWFADKTPIESVFLMMSSALAASRRVEAPSRHRRASSSGMMDVGGSFSNLRPFGPRSTGDAPRRCGDDEVEERRLDALFQVLES